MEEVEAQHAVVRGSGNCRSFSTGFRFDLLDHERTDQNTTYLLTSITHHAHQPGFESGADEAGEHYSNIFTCIPCSVPFRPPRLTPKPLIQGTQTAIVVGPAGEEIYVDNYSRVKVQFHWDRVGQRNEHSSCWIRVSQPWAGKGWGGISIPRIGQEVVIDFLEGDPDRPIITGRVYNAEQMPPYALPGNKTQSGLKSRSSKGGSPSNFNEVRFEDLKGSEELYIQAEKDENILVKNDKSETVGHDETIHILNDRTETVDGHETLTVHKNRTRNVTQNEVVTVNLTRTHTVGINEAINIGAAQEVTVGAMRMVTVGLSQTTSVGINNTLLVGKNLSIAAGDQITIKTGKASITMKKDGSIAIKGKNILIEGSGKITGKASGNIILKGSKILEN
jgi:type VI secretion system secreted protein VgrG